MSKTALTFTSNTAILEGKQGKLKYDPKLGYEVMVGAYNLPNSVGDIYPFPQSVRNLFKKSTAISKLEKHQLYGESGHPSLDDYRNKTKTEQQAMALWLNRLSRIDERNVSHQINGIRWEALPDKVDGRTVYGVYNWVKPISELLKDSLADPNQNTAFSVRSFINPRYELGTRMCVTSDIITWDHVIHGGIAIANKYKTPSLEGEGRVILCLDDNENCKITDEIISSYEKLENNEALSGNESNKLFTTRMIKDLNGKWLEVPNLNNLASRNW